MDQDKISVIMGVYNCGNADMLDRCIQSVIDQTYTNWEFIICDDGSTDDTFEELRKWAKRDTRIRVFRNNSNESLAPALNHCLEKATGGFIARMDADDWADEKRFAEQIRFLEEHQEVDFCGTEALLYDGQGEWGYRKEKSFPQKKDFLMTLPFIHPSIMARKAFYDRYPYSEKKIFLRCEDYELFMRAYSEGKAGANIKKPLLHYYSERNNGKKMSLKHRIKGFWVRTRGFAKLGLFPRAFIYIWKPVVAGWIPQRIIRRLKKEDL